MVKIYHLSSCSTCQKIIKSLDLPAGTILQDIKSEPMTAEQVDEMARLAGTYENLFSRRSMKYRPMGLHERTLTENDYRSLILEEYTFLRRPVIIVNGSIFVGNAGVSVEAAAAAIKAL